jgi:hypothetical protein
MLSQLAVGLRLIIVNSVLPIGSGDSLTNHNLTNLPPGALAFVKSTHRFYQVRQCTATQVPTGENNVVNAIGSPATGAGKRWVAVQQTAQAVLVAGSTASPLAGFALEASDSLAALLVIPGGTPGFLSATQANDHSVNITSSSGADTSLVRVLVIHAGDT